MKKLVCVMVALVGLLAVSQGAGAGPGDPGLDIRGDTFGSAGPGPRCTVPDGAGGTWSFFVHAVTDTSRRSGTVELWSTEPVYNSLRLGHARVQVLEVTRIRLERVDGQPTWVRQPTVSRPGPTDRAYLCGNSTGAGGVGIETLIYFPGGPPEPPTLRRLTRLCDRAGLDGSRPDLACPTSIAVR
jgi:hypothetical protein